MTIDLNFCMSSYLTFRFVADPSVAWSEKLYSHVPSGSSNNKEVGVNNSEELLQNLKRVIEIETKNKNVGILLSSGMDSLVLGSLLPNGTKSYTVGYSSENYLDESQESIYYAEKLKFDHKTINVKWEDYINNSAILMDACSAPLHPVEVPLYMAALEAKKDGIEMLVCGCGADSRFGGLDKLLSRDWTVEEFIERYTFVKPSDVLVNPISMDNVYYEYENSGIFDLRRFILETQNCGAFFNPMDVAGIELLNPFEHVYHEGLWDIERIRNGESKYMIRDAFKTAFSVNQAPDKNPFSRPMAIWLRDWKGPVRPEFKPDLINSRPFTGNQKYLIFCLEQFLNFMDNQGNK